MALVADGCSAVDVINAIAIPLSGVMLAYIAVLAETNRKRIRAIDNAVNGRPVGADTLSDDVTTLVDRPQPFQRGTRSGDPSPHFRDTEPDE